MILMDGKAWKNPGLQILTQISSFECILLLFPAHKVNTPREVSGSISFYIFS